MYLKKRSCWTVQADFHTGLADSPFSLDRQRQNIVLKCIYLIFIHSLYNRISKRKNNLVPQSQVEFMSFSQQQQNSHLSAVRPVYLSARPTFRVKYSNMAKPIGRYGRRGMSYCRSASLIGRRYGVMIVRLEAFAVTANQKAGLFS